MSKEAMKLALEALEIEQGAHAYLQLGKADHIENAITALREALVEQPAKQDIPDLIAGTLGVSRGTAYDLMREALAQERSSDEQPAPVQEPVEILRKDFHRRMKADGHTQTALAILDSGIYLSPTVQNEWENEKKKYIAAQRQWVGLTDEELEKVFPAIATYHEANKTLYRSIARAIEAKLKEKNT